MQKEHTAHRYKGFAKKDMKLNGQPRPPVFDRFKSFNHDDLTAKYCYFRYLRSSDVDRTSKGDPATKR